MSSSTTSGLILPHGQQCFAAVGRGADFVAELPQQRHGHARQRRLILDDQRSGGAVRRARSREPGDRNGLHDGARPGRQADAELGPAAVAVAFRPDAAAVQFGQPADDRQANSQAAFRPMQRTVGLGKQIEHVGQQIGADADAGVPDAKHDFAVFSARR